MRTRRSGGGSCETQYCTWEEYYAVSSRVYERYLESKGLSTDTPLDKRKEYLPVSMDDIMKLLKIDCKEKRGDRLCFGSVTFDNGWTKRDGTRQTSTFPYKRRSFEEIVNLAERHITAFLMGITSEELGKMRKKEQVKSGGSKRKGTKKVKYNMFSKR